MYDKVQPRRKSRRNGPLIIAAAVCMAVILTVFGLLAWSIRYHWRFQRFIGGLSNSTTYAYDSNSLMAQVDGARLCISGENTYHIYSYIISGGMGRVVRTLPEEEGVLLDYGDGTRLRLWDVASEGYGAIRERSLLICYEDAEGSIYAYATDKLTLETVQTRYLSLRGNAPWVE